MHKDPAERRAYQRRYYNTPQWKKRRAEASARYARKRRLRVLERDHYTCHYCRKVFAESDLHVDHILAVTLGGKDTQDNLVAACGFCNRSKTNKPVCSQCHTWLKPERVDADTIRCVHCRGLNTFPEGTEADGGVSRLASVCPVRL